MSEGSKKTKSEPPGPAYAPLYDAPPPYVASPPGSVLLPGHSGSPINPMVPNQTYVGPIDGPTQPLRVVRYVTYRRTGAGIGVGIMLGIIYLIIRFAIFDYAIENEY